jgi:hypothetical protein
MDMFDSAGAVRTFEHGWYVVRSVWLARVIVVGCVRRARQVTQSASKITSQVLVCAVVDVDRLMGHDENQPLCDLTNCRGSNEHCKSHDCQL